GNLRIDRAFSRISTVLQPESNVLDVGCGIGIVAEKIARRLKSGHVWACDISSNNIWYAKRTIKERNVTFVVADILEDFERLRSSIDRPIDVVTMVDVLEHIPADRHDEVFAKLRRILRDGALLVLTYPSPQYQEFLSQTDPSELQIIDESIELADLLRRSSSVGFYLRHFSLVSFCLEVTFVICV